MVPTPEIPARGRSPARANDVLDDDDWTVYSDTQSISDRSTASFDSFSSHDRQEMAPVFRLKRGEADKPVYEAWNIHYFPDKRITMDGFKVLGVKVENYEEVCGRSDVRPQPSTQSELAGMHLRAIEDFKAKHKRCLAARAIRGKGKTYEQDLEERCRGLPDYVRTATTHLLFDRGKATSTRYRTRTWTVVAMREQLRHRFAEADFTEVKRHKLRFWKNRNREEPLMYTLVIRGAETEVCAEEDGITTFAPFSNPWTHADSAETRRKSRERHVRRETLRRKRNGLSPSFQAARERSVSPPSYRSGRSRYESPAPTTRDRRYESPPPYRSRQAHSSIGSRSPSVRIRVMPRFDHTLDDMSAPTPPESFTPPPGVSAFRTPIVPTPFPTAYHGPFHPQPPLATNGMRPPFRYPPGPMLESPFGPRPFIAPDTTPATPATCVGCRSTLPCVHYSRFLPCYRPLRRWGSMAYHPSCAVCPRTPPPITHSPFFGPYDHLPAPAYFPQGPMPPAPPRLSPLSTPTLSSARFSSAPLSGPHTPTSPHSVAPEMRADSSFGSPRSSQAGGRVASPPLRTPGGIDLD